MTEPVADLTTRLAELDRQRAVPLPTPEQLRAWDVEDRAQAVRIHTLRPGVPTHHAFAVLQTLRMIRHLEPPADVEHCVHSRAIHTKHHARPVTGCPWCTHPGTTLIDPGDLL